MLALASAAAVLAAGLNAMGGASRLQSVSTIEYRAVGYRQMVEQSEHPAGPYFIDALNLHEIRDIAGRRVRIERSDSAYAAMDWWTNQTAPYTTTAVVDGASVAVVSGSRLSPGGNAFLDIDRDERLFQPELLLLNALHAQDLRLGSPVTRHGVVHDVLEYTVDGTPCTVELSRQTHLPWQVSYTRNFPYNTFLHAWGDVPTTVTYNGWTLERNGMVFAREWTVTRMGLPDTQIAVTSLTVNPHVDEKLLTVPSAFASAHRPNRVQDFKLGAGSSARPHDIVPGITVIPGAWDVEFVKQDDGAVMLEAPWSANYTKQALRYAQLTLHERIKAVVTTSDSWPHIAGLREAAAQRIPIYALDLNVPIIRRMLAAPHKIAPDDLQLHAQKAVIHPVSARTQIGSGENRLEILPYRTATGERQMLVYFPGHRLLYTSDLFAPIGDGTWFTPEYVREAVSAVKRENLDVQTIFGMHYDAMPYSQALQGLQTFLHPHV
jgi:hypothetical protein